MDFCLSFVHTDAIENARRLRFPSKPPPAFLSETLQLKGISVTGPILSLGFLFTGVLVAVFQLLADLLFFPFFSEHSPSQSQTQDQDEEGWEVVRRSKKR